MSLLQNSNAISDLGYSIANSLRFQSASSQYLSRTPASAGNTQKWSWSAWVKRGTLSSGYPNLLEAFNSNNFVENVRFYNTDALNMEFYTNGFVYNLITTQVFRDPSAWYHIVIAMDTTQATAADRIKIFVNGTQVTSFSTASYPAQNTNTYINSNRIHYLGINANNGLNNPFDGYLSEVNFIDGQALTPSSFGETNTLTGQWVAKKYAGTYGTNGFYLPFSNGTSTTTLGADSSGNGNNWTLTNFTRSAGVSDCWMKDVPSGNGGASGTQPNSNYAVMNPLINTAGYITVARGNLQISDAAADKVAMGTIAFPSSGKYYFEYTVTAVGAATTVGISDSAVSQSSGTSFSGLNGRLYQQNGNKSNGSTSVAYGASFTTNDVIGVAVDMDAGTIVFYKNNTSQGTAYSDLAGGTWFPAAYINNATGNFNFGQRSFTYTPPSGFKALCTANLPVATIKQGNKYMDATTYTGNGTSQSVVNAGGFKPDLVWIKSRSNAYNNLLFDSIRGAGKALISNSTSAEGGNAGDWLGSFNSNGFSVNNTFGGGSDPSADGNGATFAAWQWQAGQGTTSSNTNGSITSTVSVNATAGFSVVTYTGTGANATVGHGLGIRPNMVIIKQRTASSTTNWAVYHDFTTNANWYLQLNTTSAQIGDATVFPLAPTSSVVSLGTNTQVNANNGTYVAYCFANITGFSKFGSYTGNGSADGPMIFTGFKPKYIMIKCASTAGYSWVVNDTSRDAYNVASFYLNPNDSIAEGTLNPTMDILSNGFKIKTTNVTWNASGATYIYMAFAESPFANSNAR